MRKLLYTLIALLILLLSATSLGIIQQFLHHSTSITSAALLLLQFIVYLATISFLYYRTKKFYGQSVRFELSTLTADVCRAFLWAFAYLLLFILFDALDGFLWVKSVVSYLLESEIFFKRKFYHELLNIFTGALAEEMVFRYFLLGIWMYQIKGRWQAAFIIIIVNLVFAFLHFNNHHTIPETILTFFMGILFTMVWIVSGRILITAGVHFMHNLMVTGDRQIDTASSQFYLSDYFISYGLYFGISALLLLYAIRKKKFNHLERLYLSDKSGA